MIPELILERLQFIKYMEEHTVLFFQISSEVENITQLLTWIAQPSGIDSLKEGHNLPHRFLSVFVTLPSDVPLFFGKQAARAMWSNAREIFSRLNLNDFVNRVEQNLSRLDDEPTPSDSRKTAS
ncbi:MAG TPA: hypothetical protein VL171_14015 [Verrucomicrobiae bacterium]|nr:hypothetical protein [Verrucomicrobiae bacterium]